MSAPALVGAGRPTLRIRGTAYPVLPPTLRDPCLHPVSDLADLGLGRIEPELRGAQPTSSARTS